MKLRGLCVVKNEADIIGETLTAAAEWCDEIYVLDNGSHDGTWDIVQRLSGSLPAVIPYKQDPKPFDDSIRNDIVRAYVDRAVDGDWWCILDADEFYMDNPREFLAAVPRKYRAVWAARYTYLFTEKDLALYETNSSVQSGQVPITDRMRYYVPGDYSELRCFRHSGRLDHVPYELRPVSPRRIRVKHFMYRSPQQISMRLETRREPMQRGEFLHEKRSNWVGGEIVPGPAQADELPQSWEERITPSAECYFDNGDGVLADACSWEPPKAPGSRERLRSRINMLLRKARRASHKLLGTQRRTWRP